MIGRRAHLCTAGVLALTIAASAQNPRQASALDQGVSLLRAGQFDQALVKLEEAHRLAPRNATIENLLGIADTQLGRLDDANQHYRSAIRLDPKLAAAHRNLGFNLLTAKDDAAAEPELLAAARLNAGDPFAHYYLLLLALDTGRDADAIEQAAHAGKLIGNDPEVAARLAAAEIRTGHADDAASLIKSLEDAGHLSAAEEYRLAILFTRHAAYNQAVPCFRRIAALDPTWQNRYNLALALLYDNQPAEAASLLAALHHEQPSNADILTFLGSAYEMQQNMPKALDAYREAAAADPSNPDRTLDYTRLLMDTERYDDAIQFVQHDLGETAATAPLQLRLGAIEMLKGNYPAARDAFHAALATDPQLDVAYVGLAQTYAREANDPEAMRILEAARAKMPGHYLLEYYFGMLANRLGHTQEALTALQNASRLDPKSPDPFFELGKLYASQEDWPKARAAFEQVVTLNPQFEPAHYQLSRVDARLGLSAQAAQEAQRTRTLINQQRAEAFRKQRERGGSFQPQASSSP